MAAIPAQIRSLPLFSDGPAIACQLLPDGRTNRKGWLFYGKKEVGPRTVLSAELFVSQAIREILPAFIDSLSGSDRVRFRADINVKF